MAVDAGYPAARDRGSHPPGSAVPRYERYETVSGTVAAGTAFTRLGQFSGRPDFIRLIAPTSAGAVPIVEWRLTDRVGREESVILQWGRDGNDFPISRDVVEVRDTTGVGGFTASATGFWAARDEDSPAPAPAAIA